MWVKQAGAIGAQATVREAGLSTAAMDHYLRRAMRERKRPADRWIAA